MSFLPFTPIIPDEKRLIKTRELAAEVIRASYKLTGIPPQIYTPMTSVLRKMNSYYTNQIEGQHTKPADIDRALSQDFDGNLDIAKKQRIALSHLAGEAAMEEKLLCRWQRPNSPPSFAFGVKETRV